MALWSCKKAAPTSSPGAAGLHDDIKALEAELSANAAKLQSAGIYLAQAAVGTRSPAAPPPASGDAEGEAVELGVTSEQTPVVAEDDNSPTKPASVPANEPPAADIAGRADSPPEADESTARDRADRRSVRERRLQRRREKKKSADRCERVCDLAVATCELAQHVCTLAERHPDEPRYEDACTRGDVQCEAASAACHACAG